MKFVIIGGDAAGMSAAMQIVRNSEGNEITTLEKGGIYSYGACGLPYILNNKIKSTEKLIARSVNTFREKYGIDAKVYHEVMEIDEKQKVVLGKDVTTNKEFQHSYDRLLIATGATPVVPKWEGVDLKGIFTLKTIPDVEKILAYMEHDVKDVMIIGGGYIGLEAAECLADSGKHVTMIERNDQLAKIFDEDMAHLIHEEAYTHNIEVKFGETVKGFTGTNGSVQTVVTDKGEYQIDLVLAAVGVRPNVDFLKGTSITTSTRGAIKVNPHMQTNVPDVFAAGDCATQYHRIKEYDDYIPLGTHANKQGIVAGLNMVNIFKAFQGVVGTSIIKFFDLSLGRTGISEGEARNLHIPYNTVKIEAHNIAGYYPGGEKMTIKMLYHKVSRKLLGAQIIGGTGVDKRIDVLATALYHTMTIDELTDLDLSYAPPFNGVWDPIQQAARRVTKSK